MHSVPLLIARIPAPPTGPRRDDGYTLVELLVVLGILALLAATSAPQVLKYLGQARTDTTRTQIRSIVSAIELYYLDVGAYPATEAGLPALMQNPGNAAKWNGPYLKKEGGLADAWGKPFVYKAPGEHGDFDVYSLGRDGQPGGSGEDQDVQSWK